MTRLTASRVEYKWSGCLNDLLQESIRQRLPVVENCDRLNLKRHMQDRDIRNPVGQLFGVRCERRISRVRCLNFVQDHGGDLKSARTQTIHGESRAATTITGA